MELKKDVITELRWKFIKEIKSSNLLFFLDDSVVEIWFVTFFLGVFFLISLVESVFSFFFLKIFLL